MSQLRVNAVTDETGGNTATINGMTPTADSLQGFRNRIINGGMVIDQRNAGASVTPTATGYYSCDRWYTALAQASKFSVQRNAGAVTPPSGYTNYIGLTSTSAYSVLSGDFFLLAQYVEGFNVADLGWGTAGAQPVTLSFWVRSSLTGTFGGSFRNSDANRSYPFTYTISAANTWEQKSITVPGDTTGTWLTDNGIGIAVILGIGVGSTFSGTAGVWAAANYVSATGATSVVGTSGATFYITGVQLEAGLVATPFERRPYGTELALCQRYLPAPITYYSGNYLSFGTTVTGYAYYSFPVTPRVAPTGISYSNLSHFTMYGTTGSANPASITFQLAGLRSGTIIFTSATGIASAGQVQAVLPTNSSAQLLFTGCEL